MRHRLKGKKLNRNSSHRKAMLANMATSLLLHEQIQTTLAKAKALRPYVEKLLTKARDNSLHTKRQILTKITDVEVVDKLFTKLSQRYAQRNGGYTRILKNGFRVGDSAPMAVIELIDRQTAVTEKKDTE